MSDNNKNKHLTYSDRQIIEKGISNDSFNAVITEILGKDPSTIGKEIKRHRFLKANFSLSMECSNYKKI